MLLLALGVIVCSVIANSGAAQRGQVETNEGRNPRQTYAAIESLVPVNFAATNLRESRLKANENRNVVLYSQNANNVRRPPVYLLTRRFKDHDYPMNQTSHKVEKSSRGKPSRGGSTFAKKSFRYRNDIIKDFQTSTSLPEPTTVPSREIPKYKYGRPSFMRNMNSVKSKADILANIKKTINSLPEQLVKIDRDDSDCNDNPTIKMKDIRGPPCALSVKLAQSSGDLWFSPRNGISRNWKLLYG